MLRSTTTNLKMTRKIESKLKEATTRLEKQLAEQQKGRETITHEGYTWEPKSLAKSIGNLFPAKFSPKFAGNSAGKSRDSSIGETAHSYEAAFMRANASSTAELEAGEGLSDGNHTDHLQT
ncbi:hypothetical protein MTR_5g029400 [Medicago truncatula]|uniref:Uncharacterized protein n=1 Tax=Medicago truncatula TaxID=3880 RepID=G7KCD1_MEDTR|nr:hypothetical protein MTR_5g029400 [Medicago truncatula]